MDAAVVYKILTTAAEAACYGFVSVGSAVSFRLLRFPDLTTDASFTLGAVVSVMWILGGGNPALAIAIGATAGAIAGVATASLNRYLRIPRILAGILILMALYTVNLRLLGSPNKALSAEAVLFSSLPGTTPAERAGWAASVLTGLLISVTLLIYGFLESRIGLALRAVGGNPKTASVNGVHVSSLVLLGLALSNALAGAGGSLIAQRGFFADVNMGTGVVIVGFASLLLGEMLVRGTTPSRMLAAAVTGAYVYRALVGCALELGLDPRDLRLLTTLLVIVGVALSQLRTQPRGLHDEAIA